MDHPVAARRARHRKERTGCITCKARHIKCDEEAPVCYKCRSTGRHCGGYDAPLGEKRSQLRKTRTRFKHVYFPLQRQTTYSTVTTAESQEASEYFQCRTVPLFCGIFSSQAWGKTILCITRSCAAVRNAVLAVGSCHKAADSYYASSLSAFDGKAELITPTSFAFRHFTLAITSLRKSISSKDISPRICRLLCLLFFFYESLQGHRDEMTFHLHNGLALLKSRECDYESEDVEIEAVLSRLSLSHSLYSRPRALPFLDVWRVQRTATEASPGIFSDLKDARIAIFNIVIDSHLFVRMVQTSNLPGSPYADSAQLQLEHRFNNWSTTLDSSIASIGSDMYTVLALNLLRAQQALAVIFLKTCTLHSQTSYDQHLSQFEKVLDWIDPLTTWKQSDESERSMSCSFDLGLIPLLFFIATKCRHPVMRRRAIELLRRVPRREGTWDAVEARKAAELVIEFEEESLESTTLILEPFFIPEEYRVHDIDIRGGNEGLKVQKIVVLIWKPNTRDEKYKQREYFIEY